MRPIDADALEEKIENLITRFKALGKKQVAEDYNFVLTVLSTAPTIEAKPVVHAHWEKANPEKGVEASAMCSNCKVYAGYWGATMEEFDFCPFCGAQMEKFAGDINVGSKKE